MVLFLVFDDTTQPDFIGIGDIWQGKDESVPKHCKVLMGETEQG